MYFHHYSVYGISYVQNVILAPILLCFFTVNGSTKEDTGKKKKTLLLLWFFHAQNDEIRVDVGQVHWKWTFMRLPVATFKFSWWCAPYQDTRVSANDLLEHKTPLKTHQQFSFCGKEHMKANYKNSISMEHRARCFEDQHLRMGQQLSH